MSVHPSFLKFVRSFRSYLTIERNPRPTSKWDQWFICQPIKRMEQILGQSGMHCLMDRNFPVLAIPQVMDPDRRMLQALYDNQFSRQKDSRKTILNRRQQIMKAHENHVADWARDVGYWHFQREMGKFNMANVPNIDPTAPVKRLQDKLGRDLNP